MNIRKKYYLMMVVAFFYLSLNIFATHDTSFVINPKLQREIIRRFYQYSRLADLLGDSFQFQSLIVNHEQIKYRVESTLKRSKYETVFELNDRLCFLIKVLQASLQCSLIGLNLCISNDKYWLTTGYFLKTIYEIFYSFKKIGYFFYEIKSDHEQDIYCLQAIHQFQYNFFEELYIYFSSLLEFAEQPPPKIRHRYSIFIEDYDENVQIYWIFKKMQSSKHKKIFKKIIIDLTWWSFAYKKRIPQSFKEGFRSSDSLLCCAGDAQSLGVTFEEL